MVDFLKKFAVFTAVIGVLASIIGGAMIWDDYAMKWLIALLIMGMGSVISIAGSMMMYGFATIVEFCQNNMYLYRNASANNNRTIEKEDDELPEL